MATALQPGYKEAWLACATRANDTNLVLRLVELGALPLAESLVDDAVAAGNWQMAVLLRKLGAPMNPQASDLVRLLHRRHRGRGDPKQLAIWTFLNTAEESHLENCGLPKPNFGTKWAIVRNWVCTRAVVLYWLEKVARPGSMAYYNAAKRFKGAVSVQ